MPGPGPVVPVPVVPAEVMPVEVLPEALPAPAVAPGWQPAKSASETAQAPVVDAF